MRAGRDLLFVSPGGATNPARSETAVASHGRRRRHRSHAWPSSVKTPSTAAERFLSDWMKRSLLTVSAVEYHEGMPVSQAVRAPAHGSVDVGGEHVRCAGERREETLGHVFVRIKVSYLRNFFERIFGRNIQDGLALFFWFSTLISGSSNYLMHATLFSRVVSFHRLLRMHGTFSFLNA